jgi:hypothetical protein
MAAKKKTTSNQKKVKTSGASKRRAKKPSKKPLAIKMKTSKKPAKKRLVRRIAGARRSAKRKKASRVKTAPETAEQIQDKTRASYAVGSSRARLGRLSSGRQSGDLQGLSRAAEADSESVDELLEEGDPFEAEVVTGVESADEADEKEVRSR